MSYLNVGAPAAAGPTPSDGADPAQGVAVPNLAELVERAVPMAFPDLKLSEGEPRPRGQMVTRDLESGEVLFREVVDAQSFLERAFTPGSDASLFKGDGEGTGDDPTLQPENFSGWSMVGDPTYGNYPKQVKLYMTFTDTNGMTRNAECSGTLIDPMHVITAGHCIYVHDSSNPPYSVFDWVDAVTVIPGFENGVAPYGSAQAAQLHSWTGWTQDEDSSHDVGIIDLDRPLGSIVGWRGYGYDEDCSYFTNGTWSHSGYPAENPFDGLFMYTNSGDFDDCQAPFLNIVSFDNPSWGGSSGSGAVRGNTVWGVLIQSNRVDNSNDNVLTSGKFADIGSMIAADRPNSYDLWPMYVNVGETTIDAGDAINSFTFRIHNYSEVSYSGTVGYEIRLSSNNVISSSDILLGTYAVNVSLPPNGTYLAGIPGPTIPGNVVPGQYFLGVILTNSDANVGNNDTGPFDQDTITVQCGTPLVPPLFTPADKSTCVPTSVQLHWNLVADGSGYDVQVGTLCGGGQTYPVNGQVDVLNLSGLTPGVTYTWRVRSKRACGATSNWSSCRTFTVAPAVGTVAFYGPPDGYMCQYPQAATIDWQDYPGAQGYEIRMSTVCGLAVPPVFKAWSDHTFTFLQENTTYYYQVRVKDACGNWGSWSTCRSLTTLPLVMPAPSAFFPPEGFACMGTSVGVSWNDVGVPANYEVEIGPGCGQGTVYNTSTNVLNVTLPGGSYVWRVRAVHPCGDVSAWSACRTFSVDDQPPTQPVFITSISHQLGVWSNDDTVHVRWEQSFDAQCNVEYLVHWDHSPATIPVQYTYSVNAAETISEPLPDGSDHYVHVVAKDMAGNFVSDVLHLGPFMIDTDPPDNPNTFVSDVPLNAWSNATSLTVSWEDALDFQSGIAGYDHAFDQDPNSAPPTQNPSPLLEATATPIAEGTNWFHLATQDNAGNWGAPVAMGPFLIDRTPPEVQLTDPDKLKHGTVANIHWQASDARSDVVSARFFYSDDEKESWIEIGTLVNSNDPYAWQVPFVSSGQVWLKVVVSDEAGNLGEDETDRAPIPVYLATAVDEPASAMTFRLEANYPNPFNPQTTIRYALDASAPVTLRIYDLQGRLVRTLVDETQDRGEHTAIWDGRNDRDRPVASGTYLYQLRAAGHVEQRPMTLLK